MHIVKIMSKSNYIKNLSNGKKVKVFTLSHKNLAATAKTIASELRGGEVLALIGDLGAGKTTFTQFLAKELKIKRRVTSPTFTIMNQFQGKLVYKNSNITLNHLDLYRTTSFKEVLALGITEVWQNKNFVTAIEWANKIKSKLPEKTLFLKFANPIKHDDQQ